MTRQTLGWPRSATSGAELHAAVVIHNVDVVRHGEVVDYRIFIARVHGAGWPQINDIRRAVREMPHPANYRARILLNAGQPRTSRSPRIRSHALKTAA